jgi:hypothetical protein
MAHTSNTHRQGEPSGETTRTKDDRARPPGRSPDDQATRVAAGQGAVGSQAAAGERAARGRSLSPPALSSPADHRSPATKAPSLAPFGLPARGDGRHTDLQAATIAGPCPGGPACRAAIPGQQPQRLCQRPDRQRAPLTREQRDKLALLLPTDLAANTACAAAVPKRPLADRPHCVTAGRALR